MDITVHHAEELPNGYVRLVVEATDENDEAHLGYHFMPADSVEWRVAQFNITPEEALDMVVTEPFLHEDKSVDYDLQPTRSKARDMARKTIRDRATVSYAEGPLPGEMAPSPDAVAESGEDDPKAFLLDILPIDDTVIGHKRVIMDANRALVQEAGGVDAATVGRRRPLPTPPDNSHFATALTENPSELAKRMIASRLEQVRIRRSDRSS